MNWLTYSLIGLATLLGLAWIAAVWIDGWLWWRGKRTISERLLTLGITKPFVAAFIGLWIGFILGALTVHLWLPIYLSQ